MQDRGNESPRKGSESEVQSPTVLYFTKWFPVCHLTGDARLPSNRVLFYSHFGVKETEAQESPGSPAS